MITFPSTQIALFKAQKYDKYLRYGQAFHQYMKLEKITNLLDKAFCDKLYNASNEVAKLLIASRTDINN